MTRDGTASPGCPDMGITFARSSAESETYGRGEPGDAREATFW